MKAIITPATFSPIKLSRVLHALSRAGQLYVNEHGELFGNRDEAASALQSGRKEIHGEQFYGYLGLEVFGPVQHLGWKDGAFTYKGLPVLEIGTVPAAEDEFVGGVATAMFDAGTVMSQLLNLEGQEEKDIENILKAAHRARGLNLTLNALVYKLFNLVKVREMHFDDPNITVEQRAKMIEERNAEAEDYRVRSMANIANNMMPYTAIGCSDVIEVRQSRKALRTARSLVDMELSEAASMADYHIHYKEENAEIGDSYKMAELVELGMPVSL